MSKFTTTKCILFLIALLVYIFQGNMYAQDYDFEEIADQGGLVVMEAENFSENLTRDGVTTWELVTEPAGFSGTGAMQAQPVDGPHYADTANARTNSPVLTYKINFIATGIYYIQVRALHTEAEAGGDDSFHAGLDYNLPGSAMAIARGSSIYDQWYWVDTAMSGEKPYVEVGAAGVHEFNVFIRECGFYIDKIVLARNPDYLAEFFNAGLGPDETLRPSGVESQVIDKFGLSPCYPNPFSSSTTISYNLINSGNVSLSVYDVLGHKVATFVDGFRNAGGHEFIFNADNVNNRRLADGIYLLELKAGNQNSRIKVQLMR
ncbi:MAG: T9SS type A sorting domain-containing protein [Bacteroidales bacterium]|nr:MAG: T9SS type A sorting domain-containing protein [Bacteroidales bacterium]